MRLENAHGMLGFSQRTVERYVKGQIKQARPKRATRLTSEVRRRWQPRVRTNS